MDSHLLAVSGVSSCLPQRSWDESNKRAACATPAGETHRNTNPQMWCEAINGGVRTATATTTSMLLVTAAPLPSHPLPPSALPPSTYLTRPQHASTFFLGAADNSYQLNTRSSRCTKPLPLSNPLRVERRVEIFEQTFFSPLNVLQVEKRARKQTGDPGRLLLQIINSYSCIQQVGSRE